MIFPMWPEGFLKMMGPKEISKRLKRVILWMGIAFLLLYLPLRDAFLIICGFLMLLLLGLLHLAEKPNRKNSLWRIRFSEDRIDMIDHVGDIVKSAEYRYVRGVETRTMRVSLNRGSRGSVAIPHDCRLILIYFDGVYCFENLKAGEYRQLSKDEELYYIAADIFFQHSCIALAYNEEAWNLLKRYVPDAISK